MKITGRNLELVAEALEGAIADLRNTIACCPDVMEYADAIEDLEAGVTEFKIFLTKVNKALEQEKS